VHEVGIDNDRSLFLLHWFLGELNAVVDNEEGVVGSEDFVVEGDAVEVLLEEGFEHAVVLD
jgi:hypothetical protein